MKKLALVLGLCMLMSTCMPIYNVRAEVNIPDLISKIPDVNNAVIYNITDSTFDYAATVTVAQLTAGKIPIKFDIGYTPKQELIGGVSIKLLAVKDVLDYPILRWIEIEPMVYLGWDRLCFNYKEGEGNNEFSYGVGVKVLSVKF